MELQSRNEKKTTDEKDSSDLVFKIGEFSIQSGPRAVVFTDTKTDGNRLQTSKGTHRFPAR
jgi:hypothetical protein